MAKVALVEFNPYHDECLYAQMRFLVEAGHSITLIIGQQVHGRAPKLVPLAGETVIFGLSSQKNFLRRIAFVLRLRGLLVEQKTEYLIFNTASSRLEVILLAHLMKGRAKLFGVLHNLKKVNHSFSQKLINRAIKNFFVLNDFLLDSVPLADPSIRLSSFYPILFPEYPNPGPDKPKGEIWISIPGQLDFGRRDYFLVARALQKAGRLSNIKILILGRTAFHDPKNKAFMAYLDAHGLRGNFVTFDAFLQEDAFHGYLKKTDHILIPLDTVGDNYSKFKIMGCYNQAFGHRIALIAPVGLGHIPDLKAHALFYDGVDGLTKILEDISAGKARKKEYDSKKWNFEEQKNKYIQFLENH